MWQTDRAVDFSSEDLIDDDSKLSAGHLVGSRRTSVCSLAPAKTRAVDKRTRFQEPFRLGFLIQLAGQTLTAGSLWTSGYSVRQPSAESFNTPYAWGPDTKEIQTREEP